MKLLIISKSFLVREAISNLFECEFSPSEIKVVFRLDEISETDIKEYNFIFIEVDSDNLIDLENVVSYKERYSDVKLLVLDAQKKQSIFNLATKWRVDGYILDIRDREEFIYVIKKILNGKKYYDADLVQSALSKKNTIDTSMLTSRENEVLAKVSKGCSNKEIAENLHITEYTVKKHVSSIFNKLNLSSRQDAIIYYRECYPKAE